MEVRLKLELEHWKWYFMLLLSEMPKKRGYLILQNITKDNEMTRSHCIESQYDEKKKEQGRYGGSTLKKGGQCYFHES